MNIMPSAKLPKSIRIHIRKEKARLRQSGLLRPEWQEQVNLLHKHFKDLRAKKPVVQPIKRKNPTVHRARVGQNKKKKTRSPASGSKTKKHVTAS